VEVHETIPWRLRTRKSAENRWDYNLPVSRVSQASLNQASATFEVNKQIYDNNNAMIETNEAAIKKLDNEILASDDAIHTYHLAQEKNAITMANGNMEAQATVAEKEWKQALKVIHEHRGEIGDYYLEGPHTTEFKALFGWPMVVAGGAAIYWYLQRNPLPRAPFSSLYRRRPISIAFRNA